MPRSGSLSSQPRTGTKHASVSDRREGAAVEQGGVEKTVDAVGSDLAHSRRKAFAARQHDVYTEAPHERLVVRPSVRDHTEAAQLRDRDRVGGEEAGAAADPEGLTLGEIEQLQREQCRQAVHGQRCRLLQRYPVGNRDD